MGAETQRNSVCCELVHSVAHNCGKARLKVTGSSMLPVVWPGDEITVARCTHAELQKGQIILYRRGGRLTAHRIEHIAHNHLITRGDSLLSYDPPVYPSDIVGRVLHIHRNGRYIQPKRSLISHLFSPILRRSDISRRVTHYLICHLGQPLRHSEDRQVAWINS